jgi:hypothetical protein
MVKRMRTAGIVLVGLLVLTGGLAITGTAQESGIDADRSIGSSEVAPGETTTVTVNVSAASPQSIEVTDSFSPAFGTVQVVDSGDAISSAKEDQVISTWGLTDSASLTYEVTVPSDAEPGTEYQLSGNATVGETTVDIAGDGVITVADDTGTGGDDGGDDNTTVPDDGAERSIERTELTPGESTTVTVSVGLQESVDQLNWQTSFQPAFESATFVDNSGADFPVLEADSGLAAWANVDAVTFSYEVTVPEDAQPGDTYEINGTISDQAGTFEKTIEGESTIEVVETPATTGSVALGEQNVPTGDRIVVDTATASVAYAAVVTANGTEIGSSDPIQAGESIENHTIELDEPLEESQNVTVRLHATQQGSIEQPLETADGQIESTASVWVGAAAYADDDGTIGQTGVFAAIDDWRAGEIDDPTVFDVIGSWRSDEPVR